MKDALHKIVSIAMVFLLLLSTISWKVEKHYCMGRLMDMALFVDVADCGMGMAYNENSQNLDETKQPCCDDEVIFIDGQDDLKIVFNDLDTDQQSFLIAFKHSYLNLFHVQTEKSVPFEQYPPPILVKDIQLLDEVFLI